MKPSVSIEVLEEELRLLKDENEILKEENIQLRALLIPNDWEPPLEFGLTKTEKIILAALYKSGNTVSKEKLMDILYQYHYSDKIPHSKIIDVYICKMRKKCLPYNIHIDTVHSQGYKLSMSSFEILNNWES